jgi:starch synthase
VLFATSEVAPLVKTGGLADVAAALPKALTQAGCEVRILLPAYGDVYRALPQSRLLQRLEIAGHSVEVLEVHPPQLPTVWLVHCPALFDRSGNPYLGPDGQDWPDNPERFALFSRVIAALSRTDGDGFQPQIVHLNDWQTALAAALIADRQPRPGLVFTLHNLQFQGLFDGSLFDRLALPDRLRGPEGLEFHGGLSFIKGGLVFADQITTVSPTYAREIQTPQYGVGLEGLLRHRATALVGILNGIDTEVWHPARDVYIDTRYDAETLNRKAANKRALQAAMGLPAEPAPLFGMVSRLTEQKGIDLVIAALPRLRELGVQLAILGSGAARFEQALAAAAAEHPTRIAFTAGYNEPLAHQIEAGADLFLMPSRFEPCGLNQMYSMTYGTPPLVNRTGGLADTVRDAQIDPDSGKETGTGFVMAGPRLEDLIAASERALACWREPIRWRALQLNGMQQDCSWAASCARYLELYQGLLAAPDRSHGIA